MENKIGYAVISIADYKALLEDNKDKAECIKELNETNFICKDIYEKLEKYFFNHILDNEEYHLKNLKECIPIDYNYQELYKCFLQIGIDDATYIHTSIVRLKHIFDNKEE